MTNGSSPICIHTGLLLCRLTLLPLARWRSSRYVFTMHRMLIRRGVLRHVGRDILLQHIHHVASSQSLWDRIVRAVTITIESAGKHGAETLHNIRRLDQVQQMLKRLIEEDGERRAREAYGGALHYERPPRSPTSAIRNSLRAGSSSYQPQDRRHASDGGGEYGER